MLILLLSFLWTPLASQPLATSWFFLHTLLLSQHYDRIPDRKSLNMERICLDSWSKRVQSIVVGKACMEVGPALSVPEYGMMTGY